ncbi:hypothetical protein GOP47_0015014 [Adiantum capillus-veneris]|uniref:Uncharacterized protein n=1 Tax=Adiantum capillus-veneris TaxID=13818 RepID=A0A9D4UML3_ADICA|nr:hypothetical protein GOP47_0015014 [Adiantum capillus-veneris]
MKATKSRSLCSDEVADHASREEYLAEALTRRGKRDAVAAKYKHDSSEPCFLARKYLSKAQSMNVHRPGALGAVTTLHVLSLHNDDQRAAAKTYEGRFNIVSSRRRNRAEARDRPQYVQHHEQESSCNRRQHRLYDIRVARNSASSPLHLHPGEIKVTRTTKKVRFSCSDVDHPELQDVNGGGAARTLKDADKKMSPFSSRLAGRRCAGQTETTTIKKGQGPTEEIVQTNTSSTSNNAPSSSTLKSSATSHATKRPDATAPEPLKPSWQKT